MLRTLASMGGGALDCYNKKNLTYCWSHNGDEQNTKRMAFIWYYAGQEIYETAGFGSHEEWLEKQVLEKLNVEYYPPAGKDGGKSCIRLLYSKTFNTYRYNLMRNPGGNHQNLVGVTHPKVNIR